MYINTVENIRDELVSLYQNKSFVTDKTGTAVYKGTNYTFDINKVIRNNDS